MWSDELVVYSVTKLQHQCSEHSHNGGGGGSNSVASVTDEELTEVWGYPPKWSSKVMIEGGADAGLLCGLVCTMLENGDKNESSCARNGEGGADTCGGDALSILTTSSVVGPGDSGS